MLHNCNLYCYTAASAIYLVSIYLFEVHSMTNNTIKVDVAASTSRLAGVSSTGLSSLGRPFLFGPVLVLQDPLEEDHHVLHLGQVQATYVFLPIDLVI